MIQPLILGKEKISEDSVHILLRVGAGEILDEVVAWTVEDNWWGLENMSFVPGKLGGAIIQNAGCYGQEIAEVVESVEVYDREKEEFNTLSKSRCGFTYRHSIFNTSYEGRYIVTSVNLRLTKDGFPNLQYKDVTNHFGDRVPSQKELREAIVGIRKDKGQDTSQFWTAGSFFSNFKLNKDEFETLIAKIGSNFSKEKAEELRDLVEKIKAPSDGGMIKVSAAWILDQLLGLKGMSVGGAQLSWMHVLSVRNTGNATAGDCMELFKKVRRVVHEKTGLLAVNEPYLVGFTKEELDNYFALD